MAEAKKVAKKKTKAEEKKQLDKVIKADKIVAKKEAKEIVAEAQELVSATKAGKHSAKALKEAAEKQAKEERKAAKTPAKAEEAKKASKKPPRSRAERAGKKYREVAKAIELGKTYELKEAVELLTKTSPAKFDATVELHVNLNIDPTQSDQNVRGTLVLPAGSGKNVRVAVLTEDDKEQVLAKLDKEQIDFDVLITTPTMMPKLGKYARLLGPRGLMPNPKSGTVTTDVKTAVEEAKAGRVEFRTDQAGIVHLAVGKVSFAPDKLQQNIEAAMTSLRGAKPSGVKGPFVKSVYLATTMGPSIRISVENT